MTLFLALLSLPPCTLVKKYLRHKQAVRDDQHQKHFFPEKVLQVCLADQQLELPPLRKLFLHHVTEFHKIYVLHPACPTTEPKKTQFRKVTIFLLYWVLHFICPQQVNAWWSPCSNASCPHSLTEDKVLAWIQFLFCFVQKTLADWSHWDVRNVSPLAITQ